MLFLLLAQNENLFNDYFWHFLISIDPVDDFQFFACKNIHCYSLNLKKYSYASFLLDFAIRFDPVDEFYTQNSQKALQNRHFRAIFIHFIFVSLIVVFFGQKTQKAYNTRHQKHLTAPFSRWIYFLIQKVAQAQLPQGFKAFLNILFLSGLFFRKISPKCHTAHGRSTIKSSFWLAKFTFLTKFCSKPSATRLQGNFEANFKAFFTVL